VEPSWRGERALGRLEALDREWPEHRPPSSQRPAAQRPAAQRPASQPARTTYRRGIRSRGPLVALALPVALGVLALLMLNGSHSTARGVGGFVAAILAAPLLPAFGAPIRSEASRLFLAVVASGVVWLLVGALASRRANRRAAPGWGGFWAEYLLLAMSVWAGVVLSLLASNLVLGRVLV
jgi:hypothetical protein